MSNTSKIKLTILKTLINDLEKQLEVANQAENDYALQPSDDKMAAFVSEISKAFGLASGVTTESTLVAGDITTITQMMIGGKSNPQNVLQDIMKDLGLKLKPPAKTVEEVAKPMFTSNKPPKNNGSAN